MTRIRFLFLLPLLALTVLLGACAGTPAEDQAHLSEAAPPADAETTPATTVAPTPPAEEVEEPPVTIARSDAALTVRAAPDDTAPVVAELSATTSFGSPRALFVLDRQPGWVEVQVPVRPNGTAGWVPETAVDLVGSTLRVEVDLAARHLTVFDDDAVLLETPVAVGAPDAPTPTGTFAIIDRLQSPNPDSDYGPIALGLGGYSFVYSEFAGGNGQIGIHGTSDPTSIGQAVSHGCVRVPNDIAVRLGELLPLGTPVTIV